MKSTFYIIVILLIISCQSKKQNNNDSILENLTIEEVKFIKKIYKQETEWDNYEKTKKTLLGLSDLESLPLKEGEFAYQFDLKAEYDKYLQAYEIIDMNQSEIVNIKVIKYNISRDCNPVIGSKELIKDCIQVIEQSDIKIDRKTMSSLNELILQNGFWESTEKESDIRRYTDLLYHGESWAMKGAYAIEYSGINGIDTTITKTHRVYRHIPEDFKAFKEIGTKIILLANEEKADDNMSN